MAITTLQGVRDGLQQPQHFMKVAPTNEAAALWGSHWLDAGGRPGPGVGSSAGMAGEALSSSSALIAGQIPFWDPPSGNSYLARFLAHTGNVQTVGLFDRLWQQSGINVTTTTAQTINSVAFPARDRTGTVNGNDVMFGIEVIATLGNASPVTTAVASYTNDSATAGRTATMTSIPTTAVLGTFIPFEFNAGDNGVKSIQTITLGTTLTSGTINLVALRCIGMIGLSLANLDYWLEPSTGPFTRMYNGTVPFLMSWANAATSYITGGQMMVAQG